MRSPTRYTSRRRTIGFVVAARVTVSACLALIGLGSAPVAALPSPTITLVRVNPVEVRASGFAAGERVRVTVRADNVTSTTATANRDGDFDARVRGARASRCHALLITALGADGGHAALRRHPQCPVRTRG